MISQSCLFCLYKEARPLCVQKSFMIGLFFARHCNSNYDWSQEFVSHIKPKKTSDPRLRWKRFLSDLTPRPPSKPTFRLRPKSMDKSLAMSLGPPSISSLFFTKINTSLLSNMDDLSVNSPLEYYKKNQTRDLKLSSKSLRGDGLKLDTVKSNKKSDIPFVKTKTKPQNYLSKSVSKWTLKMLSKYMNLEEHVEELVIDTDGVDFSREVADVIQETMNVLHTSHRKPSLHHVLSSESDVRIFLTALLKNLCPRLGVSLKTEEKVHLVQLPICKFDFLFLTHDGKPIGCMEAKAASTMTGKAFAQAVVQLLLLQQLAWKHDVDIATVPLFNVLTDGRRFVLMQVQGEKLFLEYEWRGDHNVLQVRTSKVMEALFSLIKMTINRQP